MEIGDRGRFVRDALERRIEKIRSPFIDLHDPEGIYFHRASNACLATFIAAWILYFFPGVQPLLVLSTLCFTLTTGPLNRPGEPMTLFGSLIVVASGTSFLSLTWFQPLLQGAILILLGFLVHYLSGLHRIFAGGIFVWILCLLAAAVNPNVAQLPITLLDLVLGASIAYVCYFALLPYHPVGVFHSLRGRVGQRLAARLQQAIDLFPASGIDDRAIVSLLAAQHSLVRHLAAKNRILHGEIECYRQAITQCEELFEAILVLEQSLQALPHDDSVLRSELMDLGRRGAEFLQRKDLQAIEIELGFERWLEEHESDPNLPLTTRLSWQNTRRAILDTIQKINALENNQLLDEIPEFRPIDEHSSPRKLFDIHYPVHRRALRTAIAILLAMIVVALIRPPHGEWIILSAFIVSQDTVGSSLWKAEGRFTGAGLGAIASLAIYALIRPYHSLIFITAFLTIFPYVYLLSALDNYGFAYFFLQVAYVCFLAAIGKPLSIELIEWRAVSIAIGCALGIAVALLIFPTSMRPRLQKGQLRAWNEMRRWFGAIVSVYRLPTVENRRKLAPLSTAAARSVFALEKHLAKREHELIGQLKQGFNPATLQREDTEFIEAYQPIYRSLLYLEAIGKKLSPVQQPSSATEEIIQRLERIFQDIDGAIGVHSLYSIAPLEKLPIGLENHPEELNFFLQLQSLYQAIAAYSERRNRFLSLLADTSATGRI